jgi:hypothetical protein
VSFSIQFSSKIPKQREISQVRAIRSGNGVALSNIYTWLDFEKSQTIGGHPRMTRVFINDKNYKQYRYWHYGGKRIAHGVLVSMIPDKESAKLPYLHLPMQPVQFFRVSILLGSDSDKAQQARLSSGKLPIIF